MVHTTVQLNRVFISMIMMLVACACDLNSHDVCRNMACLHQLVLYHMHKNECEMHIIVNVCLCMHKNEK